MELCKQCLKECYVYLATHKRKCFFILIGIVIFFLIMPIYPSATSKIFEIQIPHKAYETQRAVDYKIQVLENYCQYNDIKTEFRGFSNIPADNILKTSNGIIKRTLNFSFNQYEIVIFGIEKCDCIPDADVSFGVSKNCTVNNSRVFGYFREINSTEYSLIPFVLDSKLQLLSPDKKFKLAFEIMQVKEGVSNEGYFYANSEYTIKSIITYPELKPHPIAFAVAKLINLAKDPLTAVYDAQKEKWEYK